MSNMPFVWDHDAVHEPGLHIKPSTITGKALHRAFCTCGWESAVWYRNSDKAVDRWKIHDEAVQSERDDSAARARKDGWYPQFRAQSPLGCPTPKDADSWTWKTWWRWEKP